MNPDGTCNISYDDGDVETAVAASLIRFTADASKKEEELEEEEEVQGVKAPDLSSCIGWHVSICVSEHDKQDEEWIDGVVTTFDEFTETLTIKREDSVMVEMARLDKNLLYIKPGALSVLSDAPIKNAVAASSEGDDNEFDF